MYKVTAAIVVALGMVGLLSQEAGAWQVDLKQNVDATRLKQACSDAGGTFDSDASGHWCDNSENKGTYVSCTPDGTCWGAGPGPRPRLVGSGAGRLLGILKGSGPASQAPQAPLNPKGGTVVPSSAAGVKQVSPSGPSGPILKSPGGDFKTLTPTGPSGPTILKDGRR